MGFAGHPLMPICAVFDSILRRAALEREQADDRITTPAGPIDTWIGKKFDRLADAKFMF